MKALILECPCSPAAGEKVCFFRCFPPQRQSPGYEAWGVGVFQLPPAVKDGLPFGCRPACRCVPLAVPGIAVEVLHGGLCKPPAARCKGLSASDFHREAVVHDELRASF